MEEWVEYVDLTEAVYGGFVYGGGFPYGQSEDAEEWSEVED